MLSFSKESKYIPLLEEKPISSVFEPLKFISDLFIFKLSFFLFSGSSSSSSTSFTPYKSIEIFWALLKAEAFSFFWLIFLSFNLNFSITFLFPKLLLFCRLNFWELIPEVFNLLNLLILVRLFIATEGLNISLFFTSLFKFSIFFCNFFISSSKSTFLSFIVFIKLFKSTFCCVNSSIFCSLLFLSLDKVWFTNSISTI